MMDLPIVLAHLRDPLPEEHSLVEAYVAAAEAWVEQHCNRKLVTNEPAGPEEMALTKDVQQAILLLVGHWYTNREAVVVGAAPASVPMAVESLLWYRKRF